MHLNNFLSNSHRIEQRSHTIQNILFLKETHWNLVKNNKILIEKKNVIVIFLFIFCLENVYIKFCIKTLKNNGLRITLVLQPLFVLCITITQFIFCLFKTKNLTRFLYQYHPKYRNYTLKLLLFFFSQNWRTLYLLLPPIFLPTRLWSNEKLSELPLLSEIMFVKKYWK